jgi:hypothetical protein
MPAPSQPPQDWQTLTALTGGQSITIERVRLTGKDIAIEGAFVLPELACLSAEDQIFVAAFVRGHGSIKDMERMFGVSYPTIKARLTRIAGSLAFLDVEPAPSGAEIIDRLSRGEIDPQNAIAELEALK